MTQETSKRQQRREKQQRESMRRRLVTIGLVSLGAVFIAFMVISQAASLRTAVVTPQASAVRPEGEGLTLGDPNAPVKIEVFEDFQCPACKQFSEKVEPEVLAKLVANGQAYYVFRQYPFIDQNSSTKESHQAANASMCASEQGKFWEYHDALFANWNGENEGAFNDARLREFAGAVGLDVEAFNACFDEDRYAADIEADFNLGSQMGVSGTPSVFVNGVMVAPGYIPSFDDIAAAVAEAQK
jgi:protein-disulfide isomerase